MRIILNIPARLARDIVGHAHCGYWINAYTHRVRPDASGLYIGRPVKGGEADGDGRIPRPRAFVGAHAVAEGLRIMLQHGDPKIRQCAARVIGHDGDGPDCDKVLQFAAYGALHWG